MQTLRSFDCQFVLCICPAHLIVEGSQSCSLRFLWLWGWKRVDEALNLFCLLHEVCDQLTLILWTDERRLESILANTFKLLWAVDLVFWPRLVDGNRLRDWLKVCALDKLDNGELHDQQQLLDAVLELAQLVHVH